MGNQVARPKERHQARNLLPRGMRHASTERGILRSDNAKHFGPRNKQGTKRRRTGGVATRWDRLFWQWGGAQWAYRDRDEAEFQRFVSRSYETAKGDVQGSSLRKTADTSARSHSWKRIPSIYEQEEQERREAVMAQRRPIWGTLPSTSHPTRFEGDSILVVQLLTGRWQVSNERYAPRVRAMHDHMERTWSEGMRALAPGSEIWSHDFREWNIRADTLVKQAQGG